MENDIRKDIRLIGLKMPYGDEVCSYFTQIPDSFELCTNFAKMFRLKKGKRRAIKENMEPAYDTYYLVYSPYSNKYFFGIINEHTNMRKLFKYFNDMNLYQFKDHQVVIPKEEEEDILI